MTDTSFGRSWPFVTATRCISFSLILLQGGLLPVEPTFAAEQSVQHVLFRAVRTGNLPLLEGILRRGTPPDLLAPDGSTPLMYAARTGSAAMVRLLLEHGADPQAANGRGATAILWGGPWDDVVRLLLEHGADANSRSDLGNTPLMVAAAAPAAAAAVRLLLEAGADITAQNKAGRTAVRKACTGGNPETVRLLLDNARRESRLDEVLRAAGPSITIASGNGYSEIVQILLEHGADPDCTNGNRGHGLNAALMGGHSGIARTLIEHGTQLNCLTNPGKVPTVVFAAYTETDDPSIVSLLQAHGAGLNAANSNDETALTWARIRGHNQIIGAVTAAGAPEGTLPPKPAIPSRDSASFADRQFRIAETVQKSLDLLQLSSDTFLDVRTNCISCHHQNLPGVAIAWARDRGFTVRRATIDRMNDRQVQSWLPRLPRAYQLDSPFPVPPRFLGYGMWSFSELGYAPDDLTDAVSSFLATTQQPDGHWVPGMLRPPLGGENILATMLAMRSLQLYPPTGRERETAERVKRARRWLMNAEPRTNQERVYRMLGLAWAGTAPNDLQLELQSLLDAQRDDGGWAQLPGLQSDAWATGQTLVVIHTAGGLPTTDSAYHRGIDFLLTTQFDDGSWYVQSRSWPFQPYFESNFPHGRDQWISAPATAWAVMALANAISPSELASLNVTSGYHGSNQGNVSNSKSDTPRQLPVAATRHIDFVRDIRPLLSRSCLGCHGETDPESNFSLTSRDALLRGGDSELPAIVPEAGDESPLVRFPAGIVPDLEMPPIEARHKYPPLSVEEIALLRTWVDQGANWQAIGSVPTNE